MTAAGSDYGEEIEWTESAFEELDTAEPLLHKTAAALHQEAPWIGSQDLLDEAALLAELSDASSGEVEIYRDPRSLLQRFRPRGTLSVTDFCSPSFCETKFCYSLSGRRDLSPSQRPTHILREDGKEIAVNQSLAVAADKILQKGKEIHLKLEQEVQLETVIVKTTSRAESLCLRLLNLVVSLNQLHTDGLAREIPVFGFVDGILVRGVIDEITKRPLGPLPEDLAKDKSKLHHYFSPTKPSNKPTHGYVIVDHKTRYAAKMPSQASSKPYRVQLMLYKQLFDTLASGAFEWDDFLSFNSVEKNTILSDHFIVQILPIFLSIHDFAALPTTWSVSSICDTLQNAFKTIGPLQSNMELIYRSRTAKPKKKKKKSKRAKTTEEAPIVMEDDVVDAVIAGVPDALVEDEIESQITSTPVIIPPSTPKTSQLSTVSSVAEEEGRIIGVEKFEYDQVQLDAWTIDSLAFWRSQREVRGVELEDVGYKCRSCEFESGCEFLERKAKEAADAFRARKEKKMSM